MVGDDISLSVDEMRLIKYHTQMIISSIDNRRVNGKENVSRTTERALRWAVTNEPGIRDSILRLIYLWASLTKDAQTIDDVDKQLFNGYYDGDLHAEHIK